MRKRKFPQDVARFFNPHKSGTNATTLNFGTHQLEKMRESSYIPVYSGEGTARKVIGKYGEVTYR